jgi:hypothetical protein
VRGDLVSVGGGVELGPDASIGGDLVAVGSSVRARDGQIGGDVVRVGLPWVWDGGIDWHPQWGPRGSPVRAWAAREAVGNVAAIVLLALMTAFLLLVVRGPVERAAQVIARNPGAALLSGVAMWIFQIIGIWLLLLLLVMTVVGCLAVPLVPVLWLFGWLLYLPGYAAAALATGRWLGGRFGRRLGGAYGSALVGVLAIEAIKLFGNVLAIGGGPLHVIAMLIEYFGLLIVLVAWTMGVGAMVMNLLNRRRPAGPPIPPAPLPPMPAPGAPPATDAPRGDVTGGTLHGEPSALTAATVDAPAEASAAPPPVEEPPPAPPDEEPRKTE